MSPTNLCHARFVWTCYIPKKICWTVRPFTLYNYKAEDEHDSHFYGLTKLVDFPLSTPRLWTDTDKTLPCPKLRLWAKIINYKPIWNFSWTWSHHCSDSCSGVNSLFGQNLDGSRSWNGKNGLRDIVCSFPYYTRNETRTDGLPSYLCNLPGPHE